LNESDLSKLKKWAENKEEKIKEEEEKKKEAENIELDTK
jgi:hypothetical protein